MLGVVVWQHVFPIEGRIFVSGRKYIWRVFIALTKQINVRCTVRQSLEGVAVKYASDMIEQ